MATPMLGDAIRVTGIRAHGHHGVFEHERVNGQEFVVDLVCSADLSEAAATDELAATIDYATLAQQVRADIVSDPVDLLETLADRIATTCLTDRRISTVQVTVHKPQAPIPVDVADVSVTLTRSRP